MKVIDDWMVAEVMVEYEFQKTHYLELIKKYEGRPTGQLDALRIAMSGCATFVQTCQGLIEQLGGEMLQHNLGAIDPAVKGKN